MRGHHITPSQDENASQVQLYPQGTALLFLSSPLMTNTEIPKPIALEFTHGSMTYRQVMRSGNIAIYHQTEEFDGQQKHRSYEVVKIRIRKPRTLFGMEYPLMEVYPKSEDWGTYGWTYPTLEAAEKRFAGLVEAKGSR